MTQTTHAADTMTAERYAELEAMPKFKRVKQDDIKAYARLSVERQMATKAFEASLSGRGSDERRTPKAATPTSSRTVYDRPTGATSQYWDDDAPGGIVWE